MASHLLAHEQGEVAFIDTTGSVDLLRLKNVFEFRVKGYFNDSGYQQSGYMYRKQAQTRYTTSESIAEKVTSMLDRVQVSRVFDFPGLVETLAEFRARWERQSFEIGQSADNLERQTTYSVADSEEEMEDGVSPTHSDLNKDKQIPGTACCGMIVIDNLTNVAGSMMSNSQIQGIWANEFPETSFWSKKQAD